MSRGRKVPSELQRLLDTSPDAVLLVDRTGSIVALTRSSRSHLRHQRPGTGGDVRWKRCSPGRFRAGHLKARTDYGQTPTVRAMSARHGLMGQRADGAEFPVARRLAPVAGSPEGLVMAVVHDVSSRIRAEAAIGSEGRARRDARRDSRCRPGHRLQRKPPLPQSLGRGAHGSPAGVGTGSPLGDRSCRSRSRRAMRPLTDRVAACLERGAPTEAWEVALPRERDRERRVLDVSVSPLRDASGAITGAAVIARDVTRARHIAKELAHQATHDALTGLVNRSEFERRLARALAGTESGGEHALCFLDLDGFKNVNDACGHLAGDELLRQLSGVMRDRMRARDTLARLGGDEFGVLLEHCGVTRAARVAEEIRKAITGHRFAFGETTYRVGVSIGIVPIRSVGPARELLRAADSACYAAKRAGETASRCRTSGPQYPARAANASGCGACGTPPKRVDSGSTPSRWCRSRAAMARFRVWSCCCALTKALGAGPAGGLPAHRAAPRSHADPGRVGSPGCCRRAVPVAAGSPGGRPPDRGHQSRRRDGYRR